MMQTQLLKRYINANKRKVKSICLHYNHLMYVNSTSELAERNPRTKTHYMKVPMFVHTFAYLVRKLFLLFPSRSIFNQRAL